MTAVVACSQYWKSTYTVGSHFWAKWLCKNGYDVLFVSDPISPIHFLSRQSNLGHRVRADNRAIREMIGHSSITGIIPFSLYPPKQVAKLSFTIASQWGNLPSSILLRAIDKNGFSNPDLIYVDSPLHWSWVRRLQAKRTIFRIPDRFSDFPGDTGYLNWCAKKISAIADEVVYSAPGLADYASELGVKEAVYLTNGVELDHFDPQKNPPTTTPYAHGVRTAVYVGDMGVRFDFSLLDKVSKILTDIDFVLIGSGDISKLKELCKNENVKHLGVVPYEKLPSYLQNADVGIIPFRTSGEYMGLIDSTNPLKVYQYLASEIPCVTTPWRTLREIQPPVRMADSAEMFARCVAEEIRSPSNCCEARKFVDRLNWENIIGGYMASNMRLGGEGLAS